jgi:hypothetical protein
MSGRNMIVGVCAVLALLVVIWTTVGPGKPAATAAEARTAAVLVANVKDAYGTDDWYPTLQQTGGLPNIQVDAGTAFVFTNIADTDLGKSTAITICQDVAAVTINPNTGAKLRLDHVKVYGGSSGHVQLANCDQP